MLKFKDLHMKLLSEKFYTYKMPDNKSLTMYDFYVLDYLKSILDWPSKNFRDLPTDLVDSVNNAVQNLYPALRQELLDAVFYAVCAEIRYAENSGRKDHNRRIAKSNPKFEKLYKLWAKYQNFHGKSLSQREELTDIYDIRKPSAKKRTPQSEKNNNEARNLSYKGAQYAIEKSGYSHADFMEMCEELYNEGSWDSSYGGNAWGNICRGWLDLNSADKIDPNVKEVKEVDYGAGLKDEDGNEIKSSKKSDTKPTKAAKKPMSVAIDHIYDLQHNTDTVFNKLKSYYKGGYRWIKTALDDKANVKSYHNLLNKASGTVKAMALPVLYNKLGQTWEKEMNVQKPVDTHPQVTSMEDAFAQVSGNSVDDIKIGDHFQKSRSTETYIIITNVGTSYLNYDLYKKRKLVNNGYTITKIKFDNVLKDGSWKKIPAPKLSDSQPKVSHVGAKVGDILIPAGINSSSRATLTIKKITSDSYIYDIFKKGELVESDYAYDKSYIDFMIKSGDYKIKRNEKSKTDTSLKVGDIFMDAKRTSSLSLNKGIKATYVITKVTPTTYIYDIFEKGKKVVSNHETSKPYIDMSIQKGVYLIKNDTTPIVKSPRITSQTYRVNINDSVECIDDSFVPHGSKLAMGKVYKVTEHSKTTIQVVDDVGNKKWFRKNRFEPVKLPQPIAKNSSKFKVGDWVIVNGATENYPGQIIKSGKSHDDWDRRSYLVKFLNQSLGEDWFTSNALKLDDQI
jgi:hypothetical protein